MVLALHTALTFWFISRSHLTFFNFLRRLYLRCNPARNFSSALRTAAFEFFVLLGTSGSMRARTFHKKESTRAFKRLTLR